MARSDDLSASDSILLNAFENAHLSCSGSGDESACSLLSSFVEMDDHESGARADLSLTGLPAVLLSQYRSRGVASMFVWQERCLSLAAENEDRSVLFSAPTSAGKTLVAEVLMLRHLLSRGGKALFVVPFVSMAQEKTSSLRSLLSCVGLRVEGFFGTWQPSGGLQKVDVAVCTLEKANGLINRLLLSGETSQLSMLVVDELHLLSDPHRGYLLEVLLSKVLFAFKTRVVAMSATLPNLSTLAKWLNAVEFRTQFRPVPLRMRLLASNRLLECDGELVKVLSGDGVCSLVEETVREGGQVLLFCPSRAWTESLSRAVAKRLPEGATVELDEPVDSELKPLLRHGVAFHHAGLTVEERGAIERAFRSGLVRVLVSTTTLASGVNLPARRVIVRALRFGGKPIEPASLWQMAGRAGRLGLDPAGECVLVCDNTDLSLAQTLLRCPLPPLCSCMDGHPLKRAILEVVACGAAKDRQQVARFYTCTLMAAEGREGAVEECVRFLVDRELIEEHDGALAPTRLGEAVLSAAMGPDDGLLAFEELRKARKKLVLENELQLVYLVTPLHVHLHWLHTVDWGRFWALWQMLSASFQEVGRMLGVDEVFLLRAMRATPSDPTRLSLHLRFLTALLLHELVNEVPLHHVAQQFGCCRGFLQTLQHSAASYAGMLTVFSARLGWDNLELLLGQFAPRLQHGVQRTLCDLLRLPLLNVARARALLDAGIPSAAAVAQTDPAVLARLLRAPFGQRMLAQGQTFTDWQMAERLLLDAKGLLHGDAPGTAPCPRAGLKDSTLDRSRDLFDASGDEDMPRCSTPDRHSVLVSVGPLPMATHGLLALSIACDADGSLLAVAATSDSAEAVLGQDTLHQHMRRLLAQPRLTLVLFGARRFFRALLRSHGDVALAANVIDVQTALWCQQAREVSLLEAARTHASAQLDRIEHSGLLAQMDRLAHEERTPAMAAVESLLLLPILHALGDPLPCWHAESRVALVLAKMELNGMAVDEDVLARIVAQLQQRREHIEAEASALLRRPLRLGDVRDVAKALFVDLALPAPRPVSTAKDVLRRLSHPLAALVLEWRRIGCALDVRIDHDLAAHSDGRRRVHPRMHTLTATGRVMLSTPPLQLVPKKSGLRQALVAQHGHVLLAADYAQMELRLWAHLARDATLDFQHGDVFASMALRWHHDREHVKRVCYAVLYGMGAHSLAALLAVDERQALAFIDAFLDHFPDLRRCTLRLVDECRDKGYVTTLAGRTRPLPDIHSTDPARRAHAERQALNSVVQGSVADIVKEAMLRVDQRLEHELPHMASCIHSARRGGVLLPVLHMHDELIYEVSEESLLHVASIVKREMEHAAQLTVPLLVHLKAGKDWQHLEPIHL